MVPFPQRYSVFRMSADCRSHSWTALLSSVPFHSFYVAFIHRFITNTDRSTALQANKKKVTNLNAYGQFDVAIDLTTQRHPPHPNPCFDTCHALDRSLTDGDLTSSYTRLWSGRRWSLPKLFLPSISPAPRKRLASTYKTLQMIPARSLLATKQTIRSQVLIIETGSVPKSSSRIWSA